MNPILLACTRTLKSGATWAGRLGQSRKRGIVSEKSISVKGNAASEHILRKHGFQYMSREQIEGSDRVLRRYELTKPDREIPDLQDSSA